jgi:CxC2 like cysteine cluster associated with KDZ transposases
VTCTLCLQADSEIRCLSCIGHHGWCRTCAIKAHLSLPFHRLQRWNGQFYEVISLQDLGFTLNLGHNGDVCPLSTGGDQITLVDSAGIFVHLVKWCRCNEASDKDKHLQLLRHRLFPSTILKPQTAFTFNVLDEILIDSLECKTSASSFYSKLRRLTNNAFPDTLPACFQILL